MIQYGWWETNFPALLTNSSPAWATRLATRSPRLAVLYWFGLFGYNSIQQYGQHWLFRTLNALRLGMADFGNDAALAPLFALQIELDALDFTDTEPIVSPTPVPSLPIAPNFSDVQVVLPGPPPAVPPVVSPTPLIVEEVIAPTVIEGSLPADQTDFMGMTTPPPSAIMLGLVAERFSAAPPGGPRPFYDFRNNDRRMLLFLARLLEAVLRRDDRATDPTPTAALSNRALMLDTEQLAEAAAAVLQQAYFLLSLQRNLSS